MDLISLQILFLLCLLLITLIGTYLPLVIIWFKSGGNNKQQQRDSISTLNKTREKILCFGNCFAAGTFFAMSFMHLVPETQKNWTRVLSSKNETSTEENNSGDINEKYIPPLGSFIMIMGFNWMLSLEAYISRDDSNAKSNPAPRITLTQASTPEIHSDEEDETNYVSLPDMRKSLWESLEDLRDYGAITLKQQQQQRHQQNKNNGSNGISKDSTELIPNSTCCRQRWKSFSSEALGGSKSASMVFGIAFHYFLEGINLGLQTDQTTALTLFMAILIHGCIMALAVSITLVRSWCEVGLSMKSMIFYLGILCSLRPIGILLGLMVVKAPGFIALVLASFLQAFSAGIFVYVTFKSICSLNVSTTAESISKSCKIVAFTCGWCLISILTFILK